jgi:hypothetical protein
MMDLRKKCNLKLVETPASFAPNGIAANAKPPYRKPSVLDRQAGEAILPSNLSPSATRRSSIPLVFRSSA